MKDKKAKELLNKYREGNCTEQDLAALESWYIRQAQLNTPLKDHNEFHVALGQLDQAFPFNQTGVKSAKTNKLRWIAAASIVICLGIGLYFYSNQVRTSKSLQFANDIKPGGNSAFLTLADGSKISLTDAINGELARQAGIRITKTNNGQLIYEVTEEIKGTNTKHLMNTIETPRGGQYQVRLPDGTHVWLNSSSSLTYPAVFAAHDRTVELHGEAYFEVAKDKARPFRVNSGIQQLKVLGTHFNVSAYADDADVKTTLLEGAVQVIKGFGHAKQNNVVLKPGEQSSVSANEIKVKAIDTEESVAWKNGYFKFNDEHIESILKKVSRWYNVDIQYEGKMADKIFNGRVSRYSNVSEVLQILQLTGAIHFKIEGRRIIVMP